MGFALFIFLSLSRVLYASSLEEFKLPAQNWIDPFTRSYIRDLRPFEGSLDADMRLVAQKLSQTKLILSDRSYRLEIAVRRHLESPAFVITFHADPNPLPVGLWIFSVQKHPTKHITQEYLKFSRPLLQASKGFGSASLQLFNMISYLLGIKTDRLEAGWLGRYVWAAKHYQFRRDVLVYENGRALSQVNLARNCFRRFCSKLGIDIHDLRLSLDTGEIELSEDLRELKTPYHFTRVIHKNRITIPVAPYVDHNTVEDIQYLEVGKAFVLADYRPSPHQNVDVSVGGLPRSDAAMPPWFGVRYHGCEQALDSKSFPPL